VLLGVAVGLVDCAVEAVLYVDLAPFLYGLGGDGLCRCTDGEGELGRVGLWRSRLGWLGEGRAVWRLRWCRPVVQLWGVSRGAVWSGGSRL
jgi:hypothetical protein